ncbi:condensation domain-containing protein [Streptomyces sp. NPDC003036]|uniref:condensation domain-containing protein n=1 Tax=Streptomyces sp. NPDC003036 TaxID=3154442 RepID=UPI0033BF1069
MLQVSVKDTKIRPGKAHRWHLVPVSGDGPPAVPRMAGYNQAKHFAVARHARTVNEPVRSYVAATFEITGPVDLDALGESLLHLVRRHEVLRAFYEPLGEDLSCKVLAPGEVALKHVESDQLDTSEQAGAYLHQAVREVETLSWPLIAMGAVVRDDSATVWFSCDHLVTDGLSTAIAVNDIAGAYRALTAGEALPVAEAGSYLEFSRSQRRRNQDLHSDDPRLDYWRDFTRRNGGLFPRFPLDLGTLPGRLYAPVTTTERLLDAQGVEAFEAACRDLGGRLSMGLLAALATAVREEGGPAVYRGLMPVNERGKGVYAQSMGWFINTLPIEFAVGGAERFAGTLAAAHTAYAHMQAHREVHFVQAWRLLAPAEYARLHYWPHAVNFYSYIDFRRMPGAAYHTGLQARMHVWVSGCNGILHWFHRADDGLHVNTIHVDTPQARTTHAGLLRALTHTVTTALQ